MDGGQAEALNHAGLTGVSAWMWEGGQSNWNFEEIGELISTFKS
jgi:hypothetical protein